MSEAFDLHWDRGWELYEEKKFDEAIAEWREASVLDPEDGYVLNNIGLALHKLGQQDAAIAEWREAICLEPNYDRPHIHLVSALSASGHSPESLTAMEAAIQVSPKTSGIYTLLGCSLMIQAQKTGIRSQWEEASAAFQQSLALEPSSCAYQNLAETQWYLKQKTEAIKTLKAAIAVDPNDAEAYIRLWYLQSYARDFRGMVKTTYAMDKLPASEALDSYNADILKLGARVEHVLTVGAGLIVLVIGGLIWKKRWR